MWRITSRFNWALKGKKAKFVVSIRHPPYDVTVSIWDLYSLHPWPKMPSRTNYCGKAEATTCPRRACLRAVWRAKSDDGNQLGADLWSEQSLQMHEVTHVHTEASKQTLAQATSILTEPMKQSEEQGDYVGVRLVSLQKGPFDKPDMRHVRPQTIQCWRHSER